VARRLLAGSEGNLFLIRRPFDDKTQKLRKEITVDEVRRLKSFLSLSAAEGGQRVVIVDAADELNTNAANALLKLLEEPPEKTTLLLIAHQPAGLLPTIRSRCRELRCHGLGAADLSLALHAAGVTDPFDADAVTTLTSGSVGQSFRLIASDGLQIYADLVALFIKLPDFDRTQALALAGTMVGKDAEQRFDLTLLLIDLFLARVARTGIAGPPQIEVVAQECALLTRLASTPTAARKWADLHHTLGAAARQGGAVNLDPAALVFDMVLKISQTAAG
jgi:DNA polymerase-3 subunit delta'